MAGGPCTGLVPPAFLDIPSVTVDALQRLVPSCEAALHAHMGLCSPSRISGCTSHAGTRWFNRDKLNCSHRVYKGFNAVPQAVLISTCQRMTCRASCGTAILVAAPQRILRPEPIVF